VLYTVQIQDPRDCHYPFSRALYDDATVVYHGTSSSFAAGLEAEGLVAGVPRIPVRAVQDLVSACDAVGLRSWCYTTVKGLSAGTDLSRPAERWVYLSANFWFARDYATNTGGETIHNAIALADELLQRLRSGVGSKELTDNILSIRAHLVGLTAGAFPVVYAVRVEPDWLRRKGEELDRIDCGDLVLTKVNISCAHSIPPDRLVAKVEYVGGAESGYLGPQPKTWDEARRLGAAQR
jgi:hypothetical protein